MVSHIVEELQTSEEAVLSMLLNLVACHVTLKGIHFNTFPFKAAIDTGIIS